MFLAEFFLISGFEHLGENRLIRKVLAGIMNLLIDLFYLRLAEENKRLKAENKDYSLLRKVFGRKQIDDLLEQAEDMFLRLVKEYADKQGITEQLKAENATEWIGRMNNIQVCVREVVEKEIIYA